MPVISITLLPGYSPEAEQRLVGRVARATRSVIAASAAGTTVFVNHASTYQRDGRVFGAGGAERPGRDLPPTPQLDAVGGKSTDDVTMQNGGYLSH